MSRAARKIRTDYKAAPEIIPPDSFREVPEEAAGERPVQVNVVAIQPVRVIPVTLVPDTGWVAARQRLIIFLIIVIFVALFANYLMMRV